MRQEMISLILVISNFQMRKPRHRDFKVTGPRWPYNNQWVQDCSGSNLAPEFVPSTPYHLIPLNSLSLVGRRIINKNCSLIPNSPGKEVSVVMSHKSAAATDLFFPLDFQVSMRLSDRSITDVMIKQFHFSESLMPLVTAPSFRTDQLILLNGSEPWVFTITQEHSCLSVAMVGSRVD